MRLNGKEAVMSDTVRVRHDAKVRMVFTSDGELLEDTVVEAYLMDAHATVMSIMFNAAIDGGVAWRHPDTGLPMARPKYRIELVDPESAVLKDGELCTCVRCREEAR